MRIVLVFCLAILLSGCGTPTSILGSWKEAGVQPNTFDKTMVLAVTKNAGNRRLIETQMVEALAKYGMTAVSSYTVFDIDILLEKTPKEEIAQILKAQGIDAVMAVSLVNVKDETHYQPGTAYAPMGYPMYGGFYGYYGMRSMYAYDPGYYTESTNYFLESNFYDLDKPEGEHLVWSAQTKTIDPSSIQSGVFSYVDRVVKQMRKDGVITK